MYHSLNTFSPEEQIWLRVAATRLQQALNPDLIIVFGSRARGTASRKSDLDLLVVYATDEPVLQRIGQILTLLSDCPWPLEVVAYTPAELQQIKDRPFVSRILQEGKTIYEHRAA